jgi:CMP-N-acetylneuraminic acid synthetase
MTPFIKAPEGLVIDSSHKREVCYYLTGAVYLRDRKLLISDDKSPHFLGWDPRAVIVDDREAVDINYESDFKYAEFLTQSV